MATAITSYLNSRAASDDLHLRLVIEEGTLLAKQKREISSGTRLLAFFGFGSAAFKNVWAYISNHRGELHIDSKAWITLNKVAAIYNASHVVWKRVQEFNYPSLYNFDPLDTIEQERIQRLPLFPALPASDVASPVKMAAFCRDLRHKLCEKYHWEESEVHELISYLDLFAETITSHLDVLGKSKLFVNALLQLRIALKLSLVNGKIGSMISNEELRFEVKAKLKELQTTILRVCFQDELAKQKETLDRYIHTFKRHFGDSSPFLKFEIERWQHRHDRAKLISFPKWYHCTPEAKNVISIFQSEIGYKKIKGFPGAFVSTKPEMENYGSWCFALSDHIETTGTKMADGTTRLPRYSQFFGDVAFAEEKSAFIPFFSFQNLFSWFGMVPDAQIWFGFQKSIPVAQVLKREHPLEYYRDTTLSYLVYDEKKNVRDPVLSHFPKNQFPHLPETIKVLTSSKESWNKSFFRAFFSPSQTGSSFKPSKNSPELAQKGFDERKVRVITRAQLQQLRELFKNAKQQFTLPKEWEDRLKPCV